MADRESGAELTLVEEDARAELTPLSAGSPAVHRKARFLTPRAPAGPSAAPASRRPLLRDLRPSFLGGRWPPIVHFWGWPHPEPEWDCWVRRLRPVYRKAWQSAGIRDAIAFSTCAVLVDFPLFLGLLECWSPETNTFLLPWPRPLEATLTLEDVMLLGGYSVLGEPVRASPAPEEEDGEMLARLTAEHEAAERRSGSGQVSHPEWAGRFMGIAAAKPGDVEHAAFLALWLSRFVLPAPPRGSVRRHVLPLAVRLARGKRVALAPAVLASIYRDLRQMNLAVQSGVGADGGIDSWAPFQLLQLWAWERFESLRPPTAPRPLSQGRARAMRWDGCPLHRRSLASVRAVLESPGRFQWRPYAAIVIDWRCPSFYCYGDRWVTVGSGEDDDDGMCSYAACLRACELVGLDGGVECYAPPRVAMQFGLDQDLPGPVPPVHEAWELALAAYDGGERRVRFYVPPRFYEARATRRFLDWQKQCALDRSDEGKKMAKRRRMREKERRRRLRKKAKTSCQESGFRMQEVHDRGVSSVGEGPLQANGDEQRRREGELSVEDGEDEMHSCEDSRSMRRTKRMEAGGACASEVLDEGLDRVRGACVLETSEEQSSRTSIMTKEPGTEMGVAPCEIIFIEIESDDEELQRQRDLEFEREIDQLKAEIASLQAMKAKLESSAQMNSSSLLGVFHPQTGIADIQPTSVENIKGYSCSRKKEQSKSCILCLQTMATDRR